MYGEVMQILQLLSSGPEPKTTVQWPEQLIGRYLQRRAGRQKSQRVDTITFRGSP
jgi:hypothetical protein